MADMRARSLGLAFAAILLLGRSVPGHAENAASKPAATPAAAQTPAQAEAPASVPRPSIAPKTAEPAPAAEEARPRRHRRAARHHDRRYAAWQPFPIYWPHYYRHRIQWSRVSWFGS
jgi:cell division septation protein DedD